MLRSVLKYWSANIKKSSNWCHHVIEIQQPAPTKGETNQKEFREEKIISNIEDVPKVNVDELSFNELKDILRLLITSISKNRLEKTTRNFLCPPLHELGRS